MWCPWAIAPLSPMDNPPLASVNKIIRKGTELNAEKDVKDLPSPEKKEEETTKLSRVEESFDEVDNQPCQEQVTIEEATVI